MVYDILLATKDSKVETNFRRALSPSREMFKVTNVTSGTNKISSIRYKNNEIILLDMKMPSIDVERAMFYLNRQDKEIPVILITSTTDSIDKYEVFRNLAVHGCIESSNTEGILKLLRSFVQNMDVDMDKKFESVEYLEQEGVFVCRLKNKETFFLSRKDISDDDGSKVVGIHIDKDKYFFEVKLKSQEKYEIPWDFVRYKCDTNYAYHMSKTKSDENISSEEIGNRIVEFRNERNLTQEELALKTGIKRENISRIESGKHYPTLETLEKIANSLKIPVVKLIVKLGKESRKA